MAKIFFDNIEIIVGGLALSGMVVYGFFKFFVDNNKNNNDLINLVIESKKLERKIVKKMGPSPFSK